jgi:uncharacterized repeat protein (TIGR01451 family)
VRRAGLFVAAVLGCILGGLSAGPAFAQQPPDPDGSGTDSFVTIAARQCPSYDAIRANRARNNIQESLRDLGADTPYAAGQQISPAIEDATQPTCTPITGWRFTLGKGIAASPVIGPWGSLSVVSSPFSTDVTTLASIPDRDDKGRILPGTAIAGATTIELSEDQAKLAAKSSSLWIQGGTTTDPVLAGVPAFADQFGFGALRCAIDNLNGDNVEWIQFPSGSRSVYCYAYYVTPPPTSGTIVIRKEVSDPPNADQRFTFQGNISYTPDGTFPLTVSGGKAASQTFFRAQTGPDDEPWTVRELVPDGWDLTGLSCTAGASTATVDQAAAAVAIRLAAGDTVTCTFKDALRPPPGQLLLSKVTFGGVGTFPFRVRPTGGGTPLSASATTIEPQTPVAAEPGPFELDPGEYKVAERVPDARGGRWHQTAVNCNARRLRSPARPRPRPTEVTIASGAGVVCLFENRFVPFGSITIVKETRGGAGTTGFVISPVADPTRQYAKSATTHGDGGVALARGDSTRHLRLGRYVIQETGTVSDEDGRWTLLAAICGDRLRAFEQGQVEVQLTTARPRVRCRFINAFTPDVKPVPPRPPIPPTPSPQPGPPPAPKPAPEADLVVTKRALQRQVDFGAIARFEITVRNTGEAAAEQVVLADDPGTNAQLVSARPSQGTCNERTPLICRLGALAPGAQATIRVSVRAVGTPTIDNLAVVGSSTPETRVDNNVARARVRVRSQGGVLGEQCVRAAGLVVAHAAC